MWVIWFVIVLEVFGYTIANKHVSIRDQLCIDPRTGKKHEAYSEWSDAYSCSRHRCQPSGKTMSMFTVGCKKVEAPDTAIECEQVVEDTNMQFPYCCTRLRCLVVVRGEIWTKVLGQPWEALPAAPWSHMYKMKKPAPEVIIEPIKNEITSQKSSGPVYQLDSQDSVNGASKKKASRQRVRRRRSTTYSPHAHTHEVRTADELETDRGDEFQSYQYLQDGKEASFQESLESKTQYEDEEYHTMSPELYAKLYKLRSIADSDQIQNQGTKSIEDAAEKIAKDEKVTEAGVTSIFNEVVQKNGSRMKGLEIVAESTKSENGLDFRSNEEKLQEISPETPPDEEIEKEDPKLVRERSRPLLEEIEANIDIKNQERRKKHRSKKLKRRKMRREKTRRKKSNAEVDFHKPSRNT